MPVRSRPWSTRSQRSLTTLEQPGLNCSLLLIRQATTQAFDREWLLAKPHDVRRAGCLILLELGECRSCAYRQRSNDKSELFHISPSTLADQRSTPAIVPPLSVESFLSLLTFFSGLSLSFRHNKRQHRRNDPLDDQRGNWQHQVAPQPRWGGSSRPESVLFPLSRHGSCASEAIVVT